METTLVIRIAGAADIQVIYQMAQTIWPQTYRHIITQEQIAYMMHLFYSQEALVEQLSKHSFLLAVLDDQPVGFAAYGALEAPGQYKLHKIYVLGGVQGKGVGKALLQFIVKDLKDLRARSLDLNVNRYNNARLFYERMGFSVLREEDIDIGKGYEMNDYVMRLPVSS